MSGTNFSGQPSGGAEGNSASTGGFQTAMGGKLNISRKTLGIVGGVGGLAVVMVVVYLFTGAASIADKALDDLYFPKSVGSRNEISIAKERNRSEYIDAKEVETGTIAIVLKEAGQKIAEAKETLKDVAEISGGVCGAPKDNDRYTTQMCFLQAKDGLVEVIWKGKTGDDAKGFTAQLLKELAKG